MVTKRKAFIIDVVMDAIHTLLKEGKKAYKNNRKERSSRYFQMAWEMSKAYRVRIKGIRKIFCTRCFNPWVNDEDVKIERMKNMLLRYTCKRCGYTRVMPD